MKFFIFIFIIFVSLSNNSYSNEHKSSINEYLKNELEDFELSKEKKNISNLVFNNY